MAIMRKISTYPPRCRWLLWCAVIIAGLTGSQARASELQIFLLHSYHQEYAWTRSQNDGFVREISVALADRDLSFATEYLDTKRVLSTLPYRQLFADYLREKYRGYRPDLIFSTDDNALQFLLEYHEQLFPGVPVVFSGVNGFEVEPRLDRSIYTGVYEVKDSAGNIALVSRLFPENKQILVVGDNSETDVAIRNTILALAAREGSSGRFSFLSENRLQRLENRLRQYGQGVILLTTIGGLHNETGQPVALGKAIKSISRAGDFVIVSMEDAYLLDGVLGGIVTSGEAQGRAAAGMAVKILRDKMQVSGIAPEAGPNVPTFDHRQLERLKIARNSLPEKTRILNAPRSIYEEFKEIFWATVTFIVVLMFLLGLLLVNTLRRKKAERALAESESFLNSVIENIPDMVFVKRAQDLRFVRLNRTGEHFLQISRENLIGRTAFEVFSHEVAEFFTSQDRETLAERKLLDIIEQPVTTADGVRYLHTKKIPIIDENGMPIYLLGISRDVTLARQEQEKRLELEQRLRQAEKMESIGTLAGGIAHDFNNILSSVIGYAELARIEAENPEKVRTYLTGTLKGAERAKELIRQILTFSRKSSHQKVAVNPAGVIGEALKMLRSTLPSTITMEEDLTDGATIMADPTQLHQIVLNLCTNAYHAMLEKGGTLAVSLKTVTVEDETGAALRLEPGRYLRLEVGDTGVGMDEETRLRMFDPYYTTKGPETGTGLGLAVVHGIVRSHQGQVHVYSEQNIGTTVHVYFPVVEKSSEAVPCTLPVLGLQGDGEHILLVDDEEDIITINADFLVRYGYRVSAFTDGRQALQMLRQQPEEYAALVTDMTMPHLTGAELAQAALEVAPALPVILCTGHSETINREKARQLGIRAYCEKPISGGELLRQLRSILASPPL